MKELVAFLEENKKDVGGCECGNSVEISLTRNNDDYSHMFGYETVTEIHKGMGYESVVSITSCEFVTHNASEENLREGSYEIAMVDSGDRNFSLSGILSCKYYNGDDSSRKEKIGMLSFGNGWVRFFRDSSDESNSSHVVIMGATGTLSKFENTGH